MPEVLTARDLAERHNLPRVGRDWRGSCPACGYPNALTLSERAGRPLWNCKACNDQPAVTAAMLGDARPTAASADVPLREESATLTLEPMLTRARPPVGGPVEHYLRTRCVSLPPQDVIRLLPDAKHPSGVRCPAMLALIANDRGKCVALHRTFLLPDGSGKAPVDPPRMTLGPVAGGAVQLYPAADRVILAEGIETALSAALLLQGPAWAAVSAGNLANTLILPRHVRKVVIAADNDAPGRRAAKRAWSRFRAEGRAVEICVPDREDFDFNDVLKARVHA